MSLSKVRKLKSITIYPELETVSICHADTVIEDGVNIHEVNVRAAYTLADLERFQQEQPEVAAKYLPVLGWTSARAAAAIEAKRNQQPAGAAMPSPPVKG